MSLTNFQLNLHTFCTLYFKYKIESTVIKFLNIKYLIASACMYLERWLQNMFDLIKIK